MRCLPGRTSGPPLRRLRRRPASLFAGCFWWPTWKPGSSGSGRARNDASDATAAVALEQETFALGAMEWIEIDASGSLPETLERARAAIR